MLPKDELARVARRWRWSKERQRDVAREFLDGADSRKLTSYLNKRAGKRLRFEGGDNNRTRLWKAAHQCGWPVDTHPVILDFIVEARLMRAFDKFLAEYDGGTTSGSALDGN